MVRGPMVTTGYYGQTRATNLEGWLATGDLGYVDPEGFLYVLDRRIDLIISGGENVYPAEVEAALSAHPDIAAAGVIGRDDPKWGQVPVAFIEVRPGADLTDSAVKSFLAERLAAYKIPKELFRIDHLPRTASGKLLRRRLVERLSGREEGDGEN
jgi:O-succinylbenzoic acid--CoA ligase